MEEAIFWTLIILFFVYGMIPWMCTAVLGFGVFRKSPSSQEVAFTFDDGPESRFTPKLLDLLKKYNISATFFVLGSKAEKNPGLIRRMNQEGHLIGLHNYVHRTNWFMTPWTIRRELVRSASIIEQITGVRPIYYRPPWGLLNLFDFFLRKEFRIVLWSLMVGDWRSKGGSEKIRRRLMHKIKGGSVILLHDSGETWGANPDAPLHTIKALEDVFLDLPHRGYTCVRIDQMPPLGKQELASEVSWKKKVMVSIWLKWERVFNWFFHIHPIDDNHPFLNVRIRTYWGKTVQLSDGEKIQRGDRVLELHFNNEVLYNMGIHSRSSIQLAIQMIRTTEQLLPKTLPIILNHPNYEKIKALYGVSMIHRGTKQFGFTVNNLPRGPFSFFTKIYLRLLLSVVHPQGKDRLQNKAEHLVPKMMVMSTKELMRRYPT